MGDWQQVIGVAIMAESVIGGLVACWKWCRENAEWAIWLAWERIRRESEDRTEPHIPVFVDWREYKVVDKVADATVNPWWTVTYGSERAINVSWRAIA